MAFAEPAAALTNWRALRPELVLDDIWDAETQRLLPLVYRRLVALGVDDPDRARLQGLHRHAWYQNQLRLSRLARVLTRFEDAGIPTMVIKGVPLALRYYGDVGLRPMNDVDVLVPTDRVADAFRLLEADGWRSHEDGRSVPRRLTSSIGLASQHSRIAVAPNGLAVDLHWHLREQFILPNQEFRSSDDFWMAAEPLDVAGAQTRMLQPSDMLLHVILHGLMSQGDANAHWVADAIVVSSGSVAIDWGRLIRQAEQRRLVLPVRAGLGYLVDELEAPVPPDVIARLDRLPTTAHDQRAFERSLSIERYGTRLRSLFDPGPIWAWRRAKLGAVRAALDLPGFLRDTWHLPHSRQLPIEGARRIVRRLRRPRS